MAHLYQQTNCRDADLLSEEALRPCRLWHSRWSLPCRSLGVCRYDCPFLGFHIQEANLRHSVSACSRCQRSRSAADKVCRISPEILDSLQTALCFISKPSGSVIWWCFDLLL